MSHEIDLSFLDRPEILEVVFPLAYSPLYSVTDFLTPTLSDTATRFIEVEHGVRLGCGFWPVEKECPTFLYFHGNGETAGIHQWIAPYYITRGKSIYSSLIIVDTA